LLKTAYRGDQWGNDNIDTLEEKYEDSISVIYQS
jgi:hypothetical protein